MDQQPNTQGEKKKRKRSEKRHRQKILAIRLTDAEWKDLQTRADVAGLSAAGYSRAAILNAKPLRASRRPSVNVSILSEFLGQMGKIGANINRIAKLMNMGGWPEREETSQMAADVRLIRDTLFRALGFKPPVPPEASRDFKSVTA